MTTPLSMLTMAIPKLALAVVALLACVSARAGWEIPTSSMDVAIDVTSLGPSMQFPGATGVWVLYSPSLSVECAPPRGCYAKTQRIAYAFNCLPRWATVMERISMDINGDVIKREVRDATQPYSPAYDAAAILILDTYCPLPVVEPRKRR